MSRDRLAKQGTPSAHNVWFGRHTSFGCGRRVSFCSPLQRGIVDKDPKYRVRASQIATAFTHALQSASDAKAFRVGFRLSKNIETILPEGSNLMPVDVRFATSISRSIQRTASAKRCAAQFTLALVTLGSDRSGWVDQALSGTSGAFFRGPAPRLAAATQSLKCLSRSAVHSCPFSTWVVLASTK